MNINLICLVIKVLNLYHYYTNYYLLPLISEFNCIRQEIQQQLHVPQLISKHVLEQPLYIFLRWLGPIVLALLVNDSKLKFFDYFYLLLSSLILNCVVRLCNQTCQVKELFVKFEIECFDLC